MLTPRVLIVTPTYNERENLPGFLAAVFAVVPDAAVLVVDDNSPDGTGKIADDLRAQYPNLHVLHRAGKLGLGTAYLEAFNWGLAREFDYFFELDADMSHDPAHLPAFLQALNNGADAVIGSRNIPGGGVVGWGIGRHVLSKGGSLYARTVLGLPIRDLTSGYKAFTRKALELIRLESVRSNGYSFQIELTYRAIKAGLTVKEVPITFVDRQVGRSKMSKQVFAEAITMVWKLRALS